MYANYADWFDAIGEEELELVQDECNEEDLAIDDPDQWLLDSYAKYLEENGVSPSYYD